jgi:siroheme synthase
VISTLAQLAAQVRAQELGSPAIVVIGDVVGMASIQSVNPEIFEEQL